MTEQIRQRRQRRKTLSDDQVAGLPRKTRPYFHPDPELPKHGIRVRQSGKAYTIITRDPYGKQRWVKIGNTSEFKIDEARDRARAVLKRVEAGLPAKEPPKPRPDSVQTVVDQWLKRKVHEDQMRSAKELERICNKYILPTWGKRVFVDIRRLDIAELMDRIADDHGKPMADAVLSCVRMIAGWVQTRDERYGLPFVKGMRRVQPEDRKRQRMLNDDELRAVWGAAAQAGAFGAIIRLLLLTAQRREKILTLKWSDISPDGVWTVRTAKKEKGNIGLVQLPAEALRIIRAQPRFAGNEFVFAGGRGARAFNFSRLKADFDKASGVKNWRLHDLRRTARSLMPRAGVLTEYAERTLGHAKKKIEGTYDVHEYAAEKADTLAKLAALIGRIVDPPEGENVVPLRGARP